MATGSNAMTAVMPLVREFIEGVVLGESVEIGCEECGLAHARPCGVACIAYGCRLQLHDHALPLHLRRALGLHRLLGEPLLLHTLQLLASLGHVRRLRQLRRIDSRP